MTNLIGSHFDHFQLDTVRHLTQASLWIIPKGVSHYLIANGIPKERITELSWWDEMKSNLTVQARKGEEIRQVKRALHITATPSMHWTGRSLLDVNRSL